MDIDQIKIGERHRKDMGDLPALADSIKTEGLLQPIGVTSDNELVFGYRRLVACRDILGWSAIDTRVVNVTSIIAGEYAENEIRKDFTISERVAILETIKRRHPGQPKKNSEDLQNSFVTPEQAVKRAGLGNTTTAREAIVIVNQGSPELIAAVDAGEIAIEPGFAIALQPKERQADIVKLPKAQRQAAVRKLDRPGKNLGQHSRQPKQPTPPPRPKRIGIGGPALILRELTPEQKGMPPSEELSEQAPGYPEGVTKAHAHTKKYGHVQLWSPADAALGELDRRAREFGIWLCRGVNPDAFEVPEIAGLDAKHGADFRRMTRKYLPLVQARLAAFAAALEFVDGAMDPATAAG